VVRNITDFGIFVGVEEGIDGLVHVSDVSWTERVKHPGEKFKKGDEVEAVVLNIDKENEKFSLGIKQLTPNPWDDIQRSYPLGSEIEGEVTKVTDFGAFVDQQVRQALQEQAAQQSRTQRSTLGDLLAEKLRKAGQGEGGE
jgi:small subunit ribosomal protein S1